MAGWHHWLDGRWVWVNSGGWWWTGRPGVLRFMGSQRVRHDWATELNWTEAEDIKKRWQEYTEELYKKDLNDPDNHNGVITHLEPDILESKVKWVLGCITMNKGSGGDGIPVELFQILKDDAVKVLHSISSCGFTLQLIQLALTGAGPSPPGLSQGKPLWMTHTIKFI